MDFNRLLGALFLQIIDGCAFRVYGHWVKKVEVQNRAALFENHPKVETKALHISGAMDSDEELVIMHHH